MKEAPKSIRYGRCFRLKLRNEIRNGFLILNAYKFGLKATESGWIDSKQLNSILRLFKILSKKKLKLKVNCSLIIPITKKPLETRMGSGKGERKFWKCPVRKGMVLFEFGDVTERQALYISSVIGRRLCFSTRFVKFVY